MALTAVQKGARDNARRVVRYETPIPEVGPLYLSFEGTGTGCLTEVRMGSAAEGAVAVTPLKGRRGEGGAEAAVVEWLNKYFCKGASQKPPEALPLKCLGLHGTEFQLSVWKALLDIKFGSVQTYGEIAKSIGSPGAARAVGTACGKNHLPILVPCHRVVPSHMVVPGYGSEPRHGAELRHGVGGKGFGGYSAGLGVATKVALLKFEGAKSSG